VYGEATVDNSTICWWVRWIQKAKKVKQQFMRNHRVVVCALQLCLTLSAS